MKINNHCKLLQKEFPSFDISILENKFIEFNAEKTKTVLFLRKDCGSYALRVPNNRGGYLKQEEISLNITKKDINKIKEIIETFKLGKQND